MSHVMASREGATVAMDGVVAARPPRLTTTLYELLATIQDVVGPDEDALIVATVRHLATPPPVRAAKALTMSYKSER
jgi:hypothetical protein